MLSYHRAQNVCERYPEYRYNISGIGELPSGSDEKLGKCSQMACFVRLDILQNHLNLMDEPIKQPLEQQQQQIAADAPFPIEKFPYKLLFSKVFPINQDARSVDEKIMDDVKYFINRHLNTDDPYFNEEKYICEFPLGNILPFVHDVADLSELRKIVRKEFAINAQDCIEHKLIESSDYDQSDSEGDEPQIASNQPISNIEDEETWD